MTTITTIIVMMTSRLVLAEINAWLPWLTDRFLRMAVQLLPEGEKERYYEEWSALLLDTPGKLSAAFRALDLIRGAWQLRPKEPRIPVPFKIPDSFTLHQVQIANSTAYPPGTFTPLVADKIGQTITKAEVLDIARGITKHYRADGYVLSQAVIPRQDLTTGVLRIRVVEGFINKVYVEGDTPAHDPRNLINAYSENVRSQKPININTLKSYMQLINKLPGVTARGATRPSRSTFGAADLFIRLIT